jgi:hypothetical protein
VSTIKVEVEKREFGNTEWKLATDAHYRVRILKGTRTQELEERGEADTWITAWYEAITTPAQTPSPNPQHQLHQIAGWRDL